MREAESAVLGEFAYSTLRRNGFPAKPEPDVIHPSLEGLGAGVGGLPLHPRFGGPHGSRTPRGRENLRGAIRCGDIEGHAAVRAGLLDRHPSELVP